MFCAPYASSRQRPRRSVRGSESAAMNPIPTRLNCCKVNSAPLSTIERPVVPVIEIVRVDVLRVVMVEIGGECRRAAMQAPFEANIAAGRALERRDRAYRWNWLRNARRDRFERRSDGTRTIRCAQRKPGLQRVRIRERPLGPSTVPACRVIRIQAAGEIEFVTCIRFVGDVSPRSPAFRRLRVRRRDFRLRRVRSCRRKLPVLCCQESVAPYSSSIGCGSSSARRPLLYLRHERMERERIVAAIHGGGEIAEGEMLVTEIRRP